MSSQGVIRLLHIALRDVKVEYFINQPLAPMHQRLEKVREYGRLFICGSRHMHLITGVAIALILLKAFGKLALQYISTIIFYPSEDRPKSITNLYLYIPISAIYTLSIPAFDIATYYFENSLLADAFCHFYKSFVGYGLIDWRRHLEGDLYSAIIRRTKGTTQFFKYLLINSSDDLMYCIVAGARLVFTYGFPYHFALGFTIVLLFPVILNLLTVMRTRSLRRSNLAYDAAERKLKDIFLNYEMICTYNGIQDEIRNYQQACVDWEFWFSTYWVIDNIIDIANKIMRVALLYMMVSRVTSKITGVIVDQMKTFNSILKRMCTFTTDIKLVLEAAENMVHSKLDRLESSSGDGCWKEALEAELEVRDMRVSYGENLVFGDVNLKIPRGLKIAVTGANGSGKSTFVRALLGLERYEGSVLVDGVDRSRICAKSLGGLFSYVPQDAAIFEATVFENITAFDESVSYEDVVRCVSMYGMHKDMESIGYGTVLVEKGRNISAAQRQKICFLRAAIRDAPVVVFDEMTSEMDAAYEARLIGLIMEKMQGKTVVSIIHNLNMLEKFDRVIFLNKKTAVGCSKYGELMNVNDDFRRYCTRKS